MLTGWGSAALLAAIVQNPGKLRYVCNITGALKGFVPKEIVESDILVSNWGDNPAVSVAEGAMALLLGKLKDFHEQVMTLRDGFLLPTSIASRKSPPFYKIYETFPPSP